MALRDASPFMGPGAEAGMSAPTTSFPPSGGQSTGSWPDPRVQVLARPIPAPVPPHLVPGTISPILSLGWWG